MTLNFPEKIEITISGDKIFVAGVHAYSIVEEGGKYYVAPILGGKVVLSKKELTGYDLSNEAEVEKWLAESGAKLVADPATEEAYKWFSGAADRILPKKI